MRALFGRLIVLTALLCSSFSVWAAEPIFVEGEHYKIVNNPEAHPNPQKIEVREFFWYGCPHCYQFESEITPWLARKSEDVSFKRVPHTMGRAAGEMHSLAYHMAENLGIVKRIHPEMFKAIQDRKQAMDRVNDICALFVQVGGVTDEKCQAAAVNADVLHASDHDEFLIHRYGIAVVPTLVVDGRYTTNSVMAGGTKKVIQVLNFLIAKQMQARHLGHDLPEDEAPATESSKGRGGAPSPF